MSNYELDQKYFFFVPGRTVAHLYQYLTREVQKLFVVDNHSI